MFVNLFIFEPTLFDREANVSRFMSGLLEVEDRRRDRLPT